MIEYIRGTARSCCVVFNSDDIASEGIGRPMRIPFVSFLSTLHVSIILLAPVDKEATVQGAIFTSK